MSSCGRQKMDFLELYLTSLGSTRPILCGTSQLGPISIQRLEKDARALTFGDYS